ncbi:MAG TPA: hypothetical protein VK731_10510 [Candidatus Cybelea sp.]|jgi:hypothetical protein|nr:hypothetical protein [Candidatus Cybelea sp.]
MRVVTALLAVAVIAQPSVAQPLAPGKPAGVRQARIDSGTEALMIGLGAAIMLGVGITVSGGASSGPNTGTIIPSQPLVAPATTG